MSETMTRGGNMFWVLVVIAFIALMDGLDGSIVNVALPSMATDFNKDTGTIAWIAVSYFVMMAGLLITFARIAKNGAIKRIMLLGLIIFTISSLFCGVSINFEMLLAFRIIQGIGAAMMGAAIPMACVRYLPAKNLGVGISVLTLGYSLGFALGPAVGGIITDLLSWHWIFLINIPLGLMVIPLLIKVIPKDDEYDNRPLDLAGASLLFGTIIFGIIAIERIPHAEDLTFIMISAVLCVLFLILFIIVELKRSDPLLNVRVFKHWRFDSVLVAYMLSNLVYMGILYLLPFYMYTCMGFSSSVSGMYLLISPLLVLILCIPIGRWSDRTQRRSFAVVLCTLLTIGCAIMAIYSHESLVLPLILTLVCMGLSWALSGGPMGSRIIENVSDESREMGSSLLNEFAYLGGTIGTALFAMLFTFGSGAGNINFSDLPPDIFLEGFVFSMIVATAIATITIVLSFIVKEHRMPRD